LPFFPFRFPVHPLFVDVSNSLRQFSGIVLTDDDASRPSNLHDLRYEPRIIYRTLRIECLDKIFEGAKTSARRWWGCVTILCTLYPWKFCQEGDGEFCPVSSHCSTSDFLLMEHCVWRL
jgi:hypothetical protein